MNSDKDKIKKLTFILKPFFRIGSFIKYLFWWESLSNLFLTKFFNKQPKNQSPIGIKAFFRAYLWIIIIGSILLWLPGSRQIGMLKPNGTEFTYLDALFTAASAFSDTGLTVVPTYSFFGFFGHLIIMVLIIIGGIGIISIFILILKYVWTVDPKDTNNNKYIVLANTERGSYKLGGTLEVIKVASIVVLSGILIGTIALAPHFYYNAPETLGISLKGNWANSLWYALFHSSSAINNAGFDIFGPSSLLPFVGDVYVQFVFIFLIILGGIGFPVLYEISQWVKVRFIEKSHKKFHWSLFSKITVSAYFIIFTSGLVLTFLLEFLSSNPNSLINIANSGIKNSTNNFSIWEIINSLIFSTFSTRNAGFSTIPVHYFQESTRVIWSVLMWIGSSPASTAGGVRTTTFALIIIASFYSLRNSKRVYAFKRRIPDQTITKAFIVAMSSILVVVISSTFLLIDMFNTAEAVIKQGSLFGTVFFEVSSAFGTTGLSTGITPYLGPMSKAVIIVLMIIGQLGVSTSLLILTKWTSSKKRIDNEIIYGEEEVTIG